jgi:hypothetical protein
MSNFCPNCAAPLDADARFCPSCRASVGVASALASELTGSLKAGVRSVVSEAGQSVPPSVWAAALQIYWLLTGYVVILLGVVLLAVGGGALSAANVLTSGLFSGGAQAERLLLLGFLAFLAGVFDMCLSTVLVYGFLTLKKWTYGVFMVWLPVKVVLAILAYLAKPTLGESSSATTTPFVVIFVVTLLALLNIGALVVEFILVRRGKAILDVA